MPEYTVAACITSVSMVTLNVIHRCNQSRVIIMQPFLFLFISIYGNIFGRYKMGQLLIGKGEGSDECAQIFSLTGVFATRKDKEGVHIKVKATKWKCSSTR